MRFPIIQERKTVGQISLSSFLLKSTRSSNSTRLPTLRILWSAKTRTCDIEKSPIKVAVNGSPSYREALPNVKRKTPFIGSMPIVENKSPRAPESSPLIIELVLTPAMIVRPKIESQKYSGLPNAIASFASVGLKKYREMQLKRPPAKLAITAVPRAFPALPFKVS